MWTLEFFELVVLSPTHYLRHSKATEELVAFWSGLPRPEGQVCPKRSDFSSAKINNTLSETFLSEWNNDEELIIVQSGTVLDRLIGEDITGANQFDMVPEAFRAAERRYYHALRDTPCAGMITRSAPNHQNKHTIYRTIQLPLLDPFGKVCYFVGTGMVLNEEQIIAEGREIDVNQMQLVERHLFDIGAGLPDPFAVSDDPISKIHFHTDFFS